MGPIIADRVAHATEVRLVDGDVANPRPCGRSQVAARAGVGRVDGEPQNWAFSVESFNAVVDDSGLRVVETRSK